MITYLIRINFNQQEFEQSHGIIKWYFCIKKFPYHSIHDQQAPTTITVVNHHYHCQHHHQQHLSLQLHIRGIYHRWQSRLSSQLLGITTITVNNYSQSLLHVSSLPYNYIHQTTVIAASTSAITTSNTANYHQSSLTTIYSSSTINYILNY